MAEGQKSNDLSVVEEKSKDRDQSLTLKKFLEEFPVNTWQVVEDYFEFYGQNREYIRKLAPQLRLWCNGNDCHGYRKFDGYWKDKSDVGTKEPARDYLVYRCRDCGVKEKTFCILAFAADNEGGGHITKIGEQPEVHIDLPPYLPTLLGEEYRYFIKGLKCEKQGFGIAAFSYYRRVVEKQKGRMFKSMADAAAKLRLPSEMIEALIKASEEQQFSKAIDDVKGFIPDAFKLDGHNPMKVLHSILSEGLHDRNDEDCLALAHDIRIVLQDMSQRIKDALRDDAEARKSLSNLMKFNATK